MKTLFIVDDPQLKLDDWQIVCADEYLLEHGHTTARYDRVINLCSTERYQGKGFYVSLVAEARGHQPIPSIKTIEDLHSSAVAGLFESDLQPALIESLDPGVGTEITIESHFGTDPSGRFPLVARQLFELVRAPLLRGRFERNCDGWHLAKLTALELSALPQDGLTQFFASVEEYYTKSKTHGTGNGRLAKPRIAILYDPEQTDAPSNPAAIDQFFAAGAALNTEFAIVDRTVIDDLVRFDGLLIRETTHLNHYTYDIARKAAAQGLIVIDDPDSILRCNNKVYLHELLARHNVPIPKSMTVHAGNIDQIVATVGLPCVLKQPDGAFSLGVTKVDSEDELHDAVIELLEKSELILAQSFVRTAFDWRVGVLDRRPLYACRYFMAPNHWQVIKRDSSGRCEGETAAITVGEAPSKVIDAAVRAANLIGAGFYGVDLKETETGCVVMEINDNPNVDCGNEDGILGQALYREIVGVMRRRIMESRLRTGENGACQTRSAVVS